MRQLTALPALVTFFRGYCPTCRPIGGPRMMYMHKARCFLRSMEPWS
jgi:hypothetical protein